MNIIDKLAKARPGMIKELMIKTGCSDVQAAAAVDRSAKKRVDNALNKLADDLVCKEMDVFWSEGNEVSFNR